MINSINHHQHQHRPPPPSFKSSSIQLLTHAINLLPSPCRTPTRLGVMNASLPDISQLREAVAGILASHSLEDLNYEDVYTILQANFVRDLSPVGPEIKKQLEMLLFDSFMNEARTVESPDRNGNGNQRCAPSPERPKGRERNRAPIKKLLISRISDFKKKRSVDLSAVIESMTALDDPRYPSENLIKMSHHHVKEENDDSFLKRQQATEEMKGIGAGGGGGLSGTSSGASAVGGWISTGLFPQFIRIQFRCPVSIEKVIIEGMYLEKVRIESQQISEKGLGARSYEAEEDHTSYDGYSSSSSSSPPRRGHRRKDRSSCVIEVDCGGLSPTGAGASHMMNDGWDDGEERTSFELTEIKMDYRFTCCLLINLHGYRDFVVIRRLSLYGIAIELFQ